jgi:hypothetical protein
VGTNGIAVDYYTILQVHPDADHEVVEAAYRQLMKKYHPDVAGDDPAVGVAYHQRAKAINEAYAVLRDPELRRHYDRTRFVVGTRPAPRQDWARTTRPTAPPEEPHAPPPTPPSPPSVPVEVFEPTGFAAAMQAPFTLIAAAYYLLPGPYEWEKGRRGELLNAALVPVLAVAGFTLITGRLAPLIGGSFNATLLAWIALVITSIPLWHSIPRVALALGPSLLMFNADAIALLNQARLPAWLAWVLLGVISLVLSARLYVFSVLPALALCWLLSRFT